jgi:4-hydroxybenzoate polyprenyltransferase
MALGSALAVKYAEVPLDPEVLRKGAIAFLGLSLVASANYGINGVLDASTDRNHPQKKHRAIPSGRLGARPVLLLSVLLYVSGVWLIWLLPGPWVKLCILLFVVSGITYNVKPVRTKDLPYVDFLSEALNNPIRVGLGWYAVAPSTSIVPSSLLLAFWFLGAFLMASKRFGELRFIGDESIAASYRPSLAGYSERSILVTMIACLSAFSFMFGALCMKHSVDLMLLLPFLIGYIVWFFNLALEHDSIVKDPERVFEKRGFFAYSVLLGLLFVYLVWSESQYLGFLLQG